jgi:tRNA 2-selenouridine synthase
MTEAPRIEVEAPVPARAAYLARAYADLTADPEALVRRLELLIPLQGRERVGHWAALARSGAHQALAAELAETHYDPRYAKSRARFANRRVATVTADSLDDAALDALAGEIAATVAAIAP